jgi:hypothetical protein
MEESKIAKAMRLVAEGKNPHSAAKEAELQPSAVYRELKKRADREKGICPTCGGPVDDAGKHVAEKE